MELCSVCGKNPAVIFLNKKDENGKSISKGYCLECAQKQGINPLKNLSEKDMNNMTKQIENIVSNLAENMDLNSLSEQMEDMDPEDIEKMEQGTPIFGAAIPLGSIFSNFLTKIIMDYVHLSTSFNLAIYKDTCIKTFIVFIVLFILIGSINCIKISKIN